ncbi:HAMP domain-containing sensor histidine kinase [Rubellicoccus peritrichatus]|uniref:histidine kinase n=1 Tax=Rubellicoccus peritrichatus TaxID=3080537 RepID=A0AAQ3QWX5_9BACT|nr:HAMP domain-containing sensor histidine kinase [Puniceicoccus sp. CR14]WOO42377.1 HAMP domain-containing sensor histidine kinase [Puniceicoccus sp. CR14]
MPIRPIFLAWLLLLGATLAIGGLAWWLLGREASRVESLAAGTLAKRVATVAESVDFLMDEIKTGVSDALLAVDDVAQPRQALAELVSTNPYVQTGFFFRESDGVTVWYGDRGEFPDPSDLQEPANDTGLTYPWTLVDLSVDSKKPERIEKAIPTAPAQRPVPFQQAISAPSDAYAAPEVDIATLNAFDDSAYANQSEYAYDINSNVALKQQRAAVRQFNISNRNSLKSKISAESKIAELGDFVNEDVSNTYALKEPFAASNSDFPSLLENDSFLAPSVAQQEEIVFPLPQRQGWFTAQLDGFVEWMLWVEMPRSLNVLGVWLDRDAVIAELAKTINLSQRDGILVTLVDPQGRMVVGQSRQSKSYEEIPPSPELSLAVGTALPGWRIEAFQPNGSNPFGRSFRLLGGVVVAGLCLAIMAGGSLLVWQARRDAHEAQRKTTFVANVSHELKTPLTSIRLFAEMLQDGRVKDPGKRAKYLETMVTETQRLTRLVNNVLDFSRLDRGNRDFKQESQDLVATVNGIVEPQMARLASEGLKVELVLPDEPLQRIIDRDALEQVLLNLLDNAAKYAASGKKAEVRLEAHEHEWSLSVCDWGPGIPARERARVFDAFYRLDDRLTTDRAGCGLGLSITARLVNGLGGEIQLLPNQPQGCCFRLTFKERTIS